MSFAPSVRDQIITRGTTADATPNVNLPASVSAGDMLFVVFRSAVAGAIGWPDGTWNELVDASPDAADDQIGIAWKIADGTEGGTQITLSSGNGRFAACAWSIRDVDNTAPDSSTVATGTSAAQPNATSVTGSGGSKSFLFLTVYSMEGEETGVTTYPTGYTDGQIFADSGTAGAVTTNTTVGGAAKRLATPAASDDAGVWSVAGTLDDWSAYTFAFHPLVLVENIKCQDTINAGLTGLDLDIVVATEGIGVDDVGQGEAQITGVIHCTEELFVSLDPLETSLTEVVFVVETGAATLDPLEDSFLDGVRPDDSDIQAALFTEGNDLSILVDQEVVHVVDSLLVEIDLIETLVSEGVTPVDQVSVTLDPLETTVGQEVVIVADSVSVTLNPEEVSIAETVIVADSSDQFLNPLEASFTENVTVVDTLTADMSLPAAPADEIVKCADTVTALLPVEETSIQEDVRVEDSVAVLLNPLEASVAEAVIVQDVLTVDIDLVVSLSEAVKIQDSATAATAVLNPAIPEFVIQVQPRTTMIVVQQATVIVVSVRVSNVEVLV